MPQRFHWEFTSASYVLMRRPAVQPVSNLTLMSLSPRKRVLNFRLTEHEYIEVKQASEELGSRCVSDFVRSVVLATTRQRGGDSSVAAMFKDIDRRIAGIDSQLYRLMEVVHHGAVSSSPPEAVVEPGRERERSQ